MHKCWLCFSLRWWDTECHSYNAYAGIIEFLEDGFNPDVILGPLCTDGESHPRLYTGMHVLCT